MPGTFDDWTSVQHPFRPRTSAPTSPTEPTGTTPAEPPATRAAARAATTRTTRRRRWVGVAAATVVTLVGSGAVAYGEAQKTVTIDVDGEIRTLTTLAGSVQGALDAAGVTVDSRDVVAPDPDTALDDGADVVVRLGKKVTVQTDDEQSDVWLTALDADEALRTLADRGGDVHLVASRSGDRASLDLDLDTDGPVDVVADGETTVAPDGGVGVPALLAERDIELGDLDRVSVQRVAKPAEGEPTVALVVQRVTVEREETTEAVAYETVEKTDADRYSDDPAVEQRTGSKGVRTTVADVTLVDGVEESRDVVSEKVTKKPVDRVLVRGTKERPKDPRAIGRALAAERGWTGAQWTCLENLWTKESNWNPSADNPTSSAYGIPQALPGSKMASAGADWATNPATQISWGLGYIASVYGTPCGAWSHSQAVNWY
ncbi:G5 domain-containing protein [Cellulosimicrobium marinum]|uniref:aggregation-promoting factor C-terminal-like domain-containing protein n=1 Tax=Cellulosimicrobium marinum TaxID=1638992 RepID=UPI001E6281DE|nr:G5 domain-containing protein [Cellulosimicrobium marinum]MCB7136999.1 G5 domain-containing protein [Cellulosimicrobium marinum]